MNIDGKAILSQLGALKSNGPLLTSVIIGLVAVLLFIPAELWSRSLKSRVRSTSISMGNQVRSSLRSAGSKDQWKEVAKRASIYARDANEIALLSLQSTQRELLSYDIFPSPNDPSAFIFKVFGDNYRAGIDSYLKRLNASECPTEAELSSGVSSGTAGGSGARSRYGSMYGPGGPRLYPGPTGSPYVGGPMGRYPGLPGYRGSGGTSVEETIREEICLSRAKSISVYANAADIGGYEFWGQYKYDVRPEDAVQDCWYYQLGYWAIEDVLATIEAMNSGSSNVLSAPVKRLMWISFDASGAGSGYASRYGRGLYGGGSSQRSGSRQDLGGRPSYVTAEEPDTGSGGRWPAPGVGRAGLGIEPCTGRVCNDSIDVMHFRVSVVVGAKWIMPFMKELCSAKQHRFRGFFGELAQPVTYMHNQITILESRFTAVDRLDPFHQLYRYGRDAVVELELTCEYVFNKAAYDVIKPKEVKGEAEPTDSATGQFEQFDQFDQYNRFR